MPKTLPETAEGQVYAAFGCLFPWETPKCYLYTPVTKETIAHLTVEGERGELPTRQLLAGMETSHTC